MKPDAREVAVTPGASRRSVLRAAVWTVGGLAVAQAFPVWRGLGAASASEVGAGQFEGLVGQEFIAVVDGQRLRYVLDSVQVGVDPPGAAAVGEHFSLLFTGHRPDVGDGGQLVDLFHPSLGTNNFFLAPVGGADKWQVVVDHRRPLDGQGARP